MVPQRRDLHAGRTDRRSLDAADQPAVRRCGRHLARQPLRDLRRHDANRARLHDARRLVRRVLPDDRLAALRRCVPSTASCVSTTRSSGVYRLHDGGLVSALPSRSKLDMIAALLPPDGRRARRPGPRPRSRARRIPVLLRLGRGVRRRRGPAHGAILLGAEPARPAASGARSVDGRGRRCAWRAAVDRRRRRPRRERTPRPRSSPSATTRPSALVGDDPDLQLRRLSRRRRCSSVLAQDAGPGRDADRGGRRRVDRTIRKRSSREVGGDRVQFFRQPRERRPHPQLRDLPRAGHGAATSTCCTATISCCPGSMTRCSAAFDSDPTIGAAFCRWMLVDADGERVSVVDPLAARGRPAAGRARPARRASSTS